MSREKLRILFGNRNPRFDKRYENSIIKKFCDYGAGTTAYQESRGKIFGAGYEIYIVAFFLGLYLNKRRELPSDTSKLKKFGPPFSQWGNQDSRKLRKTYNKIQDYIFIALVARSDVDLIALDKGETTPRKILDILTRTMEEYANYGFYYIEDQLQDNPEKFYRDSSFLEIFLNIDELNDSSNDSDENEDVESLD